MSTSTEEWEQFEIAAQHLDRIYLWGPPGIAKTSSAQRLRPQNTLAFTLSEDVVVQELLGHFIPKGGEFVWHDGPLAQALRSGSVVVVNELGRASSSVKDMLLGVLDSPEVCRVTLPTGEVLQPLTGFKIIATSNSDPSELDPALADRFEAIIEVTAPHPELVLYLDESLLGLGTTVYKSYADKGKEISPRSALTLLRLLAAGVEVSEAYAIAFGPRATDIGRLIAINKPEAAATKLEAAATAAKRKKG